MKVDPPSKPGFYWVRFERSKEWSISEWSEPRWEGDGGAWTNIGHEQEWEPAESSIVEWQGPLEPPSAFSAGGPFVVHPVDRMVAFVMEDHETGEVRVRDVATELNLRAAVRYLWNAWADAEGEGQPAMAAFGPGIDGADEAQMIEDGFRVKKAPPEIQELIRACVPDSWHARKREP